MSKRNGTTVAITIAATQLTVNKRYKREKDKNKTHDENKEQTQTDNLYQIKKKNYTNENYLVSYKVYRFSNGLLTDGT